MGRQGIFRGAKLSCHFVQQQCRGFELFLDEFSALHQVLVSTLCLIVLRDPITEFPNLGLPLGDFAFPLINVSLVPPDVCLKPANCLPVTVGVGSGSRPSECPLQRVGGTGQFCCTELT
ncbi:hypothetical protein CDO45_10635 [Pseudomonas aeruginosa]|nr:hypothetical protein CDO45_10635 [Pseudomonas aeruginosa]